MPTLLLVRHGETTANASGILAGRSPGVSLNDKGRGQAQALAARLHDLPIVRAVSSPMERCGETLGLLREPAGWAAWPSVVDERLTEVDYGSWTGRELKTLAKEPLWKTVQSRPSAAVFPDGEGLAAMAARAAEAVLANDREVKAAHGENALWLAVAHGDVIKAILADALGMHLDQFQRIAVAPCSLSVIRYTDERPYVLRLGEGADLSALVPSPADATSAGTAAATIGGGR